MRELTPVQEFVLLTRTSLDTQLARVQDSLLELLELLPSLAPQDPRRPAVEAWIIALGEAERDLMRAVRQ